MFDSDACSRRSALRGLGAVALGSTLFGSVAVASAEYDTVVDVVDAGGDPTGEESITPLLREHRGEDTCFAFPPGRYRMAEQFRCTGFDRVGFVGDEATIVPDDYHGFESPPRCFKLGTHYAPLGSLRFEGIDFDFTAPDTGVRAIQAQVADDLRVRDVTVRGEHDSGTWGPMLFDVTDPDGEGWIDRVRLPDGGEYSRHTPGSVWTGPTGVLVSRFHRGHLRIRNCVVGPFPDNGLYARNGARTTVFGGVYRNSNVASIRLGGEGSGIRSATVVVDHNREDDENQTGVRLDRSSNLRIRNAVIDVTAPNGPAVNVQNEVDSASIRGTDIAVGGATGNGVVVNGGAGRTELTDTDVRFDGGGTALLLRSRGDRDGGAVVCEDVSIAGDAHGFAGRNAIRCERDGSEFHGVTVDQRGDGHRGCLHVGGEDCLVSGGSFRSTHYPIVNAASGTGVVDVDHVESETGRAAIRLLEGYADVFVVGNVLYGGVRDDGTDDLTMFDNETPDH